MKESCLDVPQVLFKPFLIKERTLCTSCHVSTTADQNVTLPTSYPRTMNIKRDCWNITLISVQFLSDQGEENAIQTMIQSVSAPILRSFYGEKHVPPGGRDDFRSEDSHTWEQCDTSVLHPKVQSNTGPELLCEREKYQIYPFLLLPQARGGPEVFPFWSGCRVICLHVISFTLNVLYCAERL